MPEKFSRSVSSPCLGTLGTGTIKTNATSGVSPVLQQGKFKTDAYRGKFLWEGRMGRVTLAAVSLPWKPWWQIIILISIIYKFVLNFLLAYYLNDSFRIILDSSLVATELVFLADLTVNLIHAFWSPVRLHTRVYRRSYFFLTYDVISIIPLMLIFRLIKGYPYLLLTGRWLGIGRIYRLAPFFRDINGNMRSNRWIPLIIEHATVTLLVLHATTCIWYALHRPPPLKKPWHNLGFPPHVNTRRLTFNTYKSCWYYCACQFFNVKFADSYPIHNAEKWLTICLTLCGYVFLRYRFIGYLAWEKVIENRRWSNFVELFHHTQTYLKLCGAPPWLVEQAKNYKMQVWQMKDGILSSDYLKELPHSLQMQLIFDINIGHFHNTLLFKDTSQAFLRQISLLMRHELFLPGQQVWCQDVVKRGMICIKRGVVEMLSDEDDESPMIAFKEGTVLGELSLFYSIPSKVTVKAATYVELQVLRRTDFMRAMVQNPNMQQIRMDIEKRLKYAQKRQRAIENYDKSDSRLIRTRYRPMKVLKDKLAGVEEEDPTFVDDSHMYFRDEGNIRQPKFITEYLELYRMSANVTTIESPRMCLKNNFPWILEPDTDFTKVLDILHFTTVLYACLMSPYHTIQSDRSEAQTVLWIIVNAGLMLNLYTQLTTAIVQKNVRKETVKEIAEVKMRSLGFYLDILSVFPIYIFSEYLDPNIDTVCGQMATLLPIVQVWHIWAYFTKWETSFNCHVKFLCLCKYGTLLLILCYWSGCLLYLLACPKKLCLKDSWMAKLIFFETKVFIINNSKHERPMLSSLSFGTSVFTGSGISEIFPGQADLLAVFILFVIGTYMCCLYTANICSVFLLSTQRKLRFKESMRELFYFLNVNRVSGKIKKRVEKFFCVQWYYNNAVSTEEIFKDMSSNIQQEVLSLEMVKTLLCCPLFQDCSGDFLQTVAASAKTIILPYNEVVQHAADIGRDMYILQMGHCNILNHNGKVIHSVGPGSRFGVIEMLFGVPKVYTVVTTTNCQLRYVEYSALVQCWSSFPEVSHLIIATLQEPELVRLASKFDEAKPLTGKMDVKINRIAQEIKESFVVLSTREQRREYTRTFDKLGIMR